MDRVALPPALLSEEESGSILARVKARAAKRFRWTSAAALRDVTESAYWLHVFRRDAEALEVCGFLGQYEFAGNYALWTQVEFALALQARLLLQRRKRARAAECTQRLRDAGFVEDRLKGSMLDRNGALRLALKQGNLVAERQARLGRLEELCFLIELGGSRKLPVAEAEADYRLNLSRLQELAGAVGPADPGAA
jgi:hypothetical protein